MTERDQAAVEALADAWASIDGKLDEFRNPGPDGHYDGYMIEAREMIHRLEARGYVIVAAP